MNQLMRLIYQNRFEKLEDLNPISREAEETFSREIRPMLEAKLDFAKNICKGVDFLVATKYNKCSDKKAR